MLSLVFISRGTGYLIGNPIAGYSYDLTDSYDFAIIFCTVSFLLATIASIPLPNTHGRGKIDSSLPQNTPMKNPLIENVKKIEV